MSNWFERNATKSIITYTLIIITATWATSIFIIDENKVNLFKAQVDNEKSVNRQLEAKISVLEGNILELSNENKRLHSWLSDDPRSYPALVSKIKSLEKELKQKPSTIEVKKNNSAIPTQQIVLYSYSENFVKGQSFTDPFTNATIGVSDIGPNYTAEIYLSLPGEQSIEKSGVKPGTSWYYTFNSKQYKLTLNKIEWIGNKLRATVVEIAKE